MDYNVSDFYHTFEDQLILLTDDSGFNKPINAVGILDYEFDPSVKDRYICDNFQPNELVFATFLYAKKNPYLVGDAVRHLIDKGCSALLIRNVFNLPIQETIIRYANSKGFTIFLLKGRNIYFEDLVYEVARHREMLGNSDFYAEEINELLYGNLSEQDIVNHVKRILPSLKPSYFFVYAVPEKGLTSEDYGRALDKYRDSALFSASNKLLKFGDKLLFAFSSDSLSQDYNKDTFKEISALLNSCCGRITTIGISEPHYYMFEARDAIQESLYAAAYGSTETGEYTLYDRIGVYKLILPYCRTQDFSKFSDHVLNPIRDYDAENSTALLRTLEIYIKEGSSLKQAAIRLDQHENTVRYRLEKINALCNLDYKKPQDAEQLSMAIKISVGRDMSEPRA